MYIFLIILILIVILSYVLFQKGRKKIDEILKRLAAERNGKVQKVFGAYPQLTFQYEDIDILVSALQSGTRKRAAQTFAQFYFVSFPDKFFFRIRGRSTQTVIGEAMGFKNIQTGNPVFDKQFFIQGKDEKFVRALLTQDVQRKLVDLNDGVGIKADFQKVKFFDGKEWVEKPRFNISIHKVSEEYRDYRKLIETASLFYDRMKNLIRE